MDASGTVVGSFGGVLATDSSGGPAGGSRAPGTAQLLGMNANVASVEVAVPADWLATATMPVTIDPTFTTTTTTGGSSYSGYVDGDYPTSTYGWSDPELALGYAGPAPGGSYARSLLYFALGSLAGSGAVVSDAHVTLVNQHSWACSTGSQVDLYGVAGQFTSTTNWNSQPTLDGPATSTSAPFAYGDTCGGAAPVNLDATALAQRWLNVGGEANNGLELRADYQGSETSNLGWKEFDTERYGTAPALVINYTPASVPSAPTNLVATAGNGTAHLSWTRPANAGTPALDSYLIGTYSYPAGTLVGSQSVGATTLSADIAVSNGQSYFWGVFAHNSAGYSPPGVSNVATPAAPPGLPQNVVATSGSTVGSVRWVAPASNGGVAEDLYLVALYDIGTSPATLVDYGTACGTCTYSPTGTMVNGHAYQLAVWAHNGPGGYGSPTLSNVFSSSAVDPMAGAGDRPAASYQSFALDDRMSAQVDLGSGNLEVSMTDLSVPVVGGTLSVGRTYNSMEAALGARVDYSGQFGYLWSSTMTPDVRLVPTPDANTVMLVSPSGTTSVFTFTNGAYTTPAGLDATLFRKADGTYTLTDHASQEVQAFAANGQMTSDTDANANTMSFSYPDGWREQAVAGTAGPSGGNQVTIVNGGPFGQVSSILKVATDVGAEGVTYTYNPSNDALNQVTDASGRVTTFLYDSANNLQKITVKANANAPDYQVTSFTYFPSHQIKTVDRAIAGQPDSITTYDDSTPGQVKVTDADGHAPVTYGIDASMRVTSVTDPKNSPKAATFTYTTSTGSTDDKVVTAQSATDSGTNLKTTNDWGANGEDLHSSVDPIGATIVNDFPNVTGAMAYQPDWSADSMQFKTGFTYAPGIDLQQSTDMTSKAVALTLYNPDGTPSSSTSPNNITVPANPPAQDTNYSTRYTYSAHQVQTVTPPQGNSLGAQSFTYDGFGRLHTVTDGKGTTTTYAYDLLDRIVGQTFSDATHAITTGYDTLGDVNSRTDATGQTTWSYDTAGRLGSEVLPGGAQLGYSYDSVGNIVAMSDAGGTVGYHYDKVNELDQITEPSGRYDVFAYDADHRRTDTWEGTPSGVSYDPSGNVVVAPTSFAAHTHDTYDPAGNLTETRTTRASSDSDANRLADIAYAYVVPAGTTCIGATAGMATDKRQTSTDHISGAVTSYCYDSAGRLTAAATAGGPTYSYGYDADGNRIADAAGSHTFNSADQLTGSSYAYDPDGNLTASPGVSNLTYNGLGQTTAMTTGATTVPFAYAGTSQSERSAAGSTTAQNGALGVETETTGGATTTYVKDPSGTLVYEHTPTAGDFYYYFDGLGSVIGLVDPAGNQRAAYTYGPYGENATATAFNGTLPPNPWRYTGGYLDATTGLYHLGARYYDPTVGRFTQEDPRGGGYIYAGDDPVNSVDPTGTKNVGFNPNDPTILGIVRDCRYGLDVTYRNSTFCEGFLKGYSHGNLTDYGFGFKADVPTSVRAQLSRAAEVGIKGVYGCLQGATAGAAVLAPVAQLAGDAAPAIVAAGAGGGCALGIYGAYSGEDYFGPSVPVLQ